MLRLKLKHFEVLFWGVGLLCLGYCVFVHGLAAGAREAVAGIDEQAPGLNHLARGFPSAKPYDEIGKDLIGRIDIPALRLSAPITADDDVQSLRRGVGHIPGTALPGGLGTVGLAGHRDSYFRPLRGIRRAMEIRLTNRTGTYRYGVDSTEIVSPDRVDVLDVGSEPGLTLVTCYPFDYVGPAPKRFIVHARLISVVPEHILSW